ncbi:glycine dehydrogenase (decarboxylating) beta subunit [[Leptolyngbya] sp. PCC 7376]|uniref:aminomethyl-transferring glycine dehydrogenase n=1 Tax=[Leptolyngbya] sp. PCC 7376 TaxID=111781 RepID=UPI00029EF5B5|nr:aminomethyl-transferring glycine dehydrogenase [[Leptolyngbya] sp. PCC 7376]AFY40044.1 glycine dehydrogenase (decarboxylating) beta subunit [[Leptolyngbya] sp. PCC 7376]
MVNLQQLPTLPATPKNEAFIRRHIGISDDAAAKMLAFLGFDSLEDLISQTVPDPIRQKLELGLPHARTEVKALSDLETIANQNKVFKNLIGMGYYDCVTPPVIQRNVLENPGWYTAYTPYQAEIAQGRLEALLNFQTMVIELTGLEIANASLLDEGTAAAEAMSMSYGLCKKKTANTFFVSELCHPQTIEVVLTRAMPLDINVVIGNHETFEVTEDVFGALLQYPATNGSVFDYSEFIEKVHNQKAFATVATDLMSLCLLKTPGEMGADIAVGTSQRFGVPLGYGGPHAAFFATKEKFKRQIPGRIVGVSKDVHGKPALRLALQTREQHIRRDKATSNICTAQVLLAVMASMYGVYHGAEGLKAIATEIHQLTQICAKGLEKLGFGISSTITFDTIQVIATTEQATTIRENAEAAEYNLRYFDDGKIGISFDETCTTDDVKAVWGFFAEQEKLPFTLEQIEREITDALPENLLRTSAFLTDPVFNTHRSETELLRYIHHLQSKDLSLTTSMIPLGSCTMKLNATAEMIPVTWASFGKIHPFAPRSQTAGYKEMCDQLEGWLAEITGFAGVSLQPNAGSQGEYAGLQVIRQFHIKNGDRQRNICLIPESAHGTNPASAVMCGFKVVPVKCCSSQGDIEIEDLKAKAEKYKDNLAALMVTYPSTHGVFEEGIKGICEIIHSHGGQVYLDGANMNALVGVCRPGDFGADVCHLNLHKTFCIPHGGGGPGVGPICVAAHLVPYLPKTELTENETNIGFISAAPLGSASILPISWMYIAMMGSEGLTKATKTAILSANYMAKRLDEHYPVLFKGANDCVAHECIIDLRQMRKSAEITVEDIAKRLMDYGFHAPTISWPVAGTMMIEPTESESLEEVDRFCDAMIAIREEVRQIEVGNIAKDDNPVKNSPHTAESLICGDWEHPYSREVAAYPTAWLKESKFWASVGRINNAFGDRNLVCSCEGMDAYKNE